MREMLVFLKYLDTGLVPIKGFRPEDIESFDSSLKSLSPEERRRVNRKFRKIFRKLAKEKIKSISKNEVLLRSFKLKFGIGELEPSKIQLRSRRRFVHDSINKQIWEKINNNEF